MTQRTSTVRPRISRADRREAIRRDLVASASALFLAQGFVATTVDQIAAAAGVTTGAVYSNFKSKEELLFAAVDAHAFQADLEPFLDDSLSPAEQLGAFVLRLTRSTTTRAWRDLERLEREVLVLAEHDERARELIRQGDRQKRSGFAVWLKGEEERGRLRLERPAEEVAAFILCVVRDLAQQHARDPKRVPPRYFVDAFDALIGTSR